MLTYTCRADNHCNTHYCYNYVSCIQNNCSVWRFSVPKAWTARFPPRSTFQRQTGLVGGPRGNPKGAKAGTCNAPLSSPPPPSWTLHYVRKVEPSSQAWHVSVGFVGVNVASIRCVMWKRANRLNDPGPNTVPAASAALFCTVACILLAAYWPLRSQRYLFITWTLLPRRHKVCCGWFFCTPFSLSLSLSYIIWFFLACTISMAVIVVSGEVRRARKPFDEV